MIGLIQYKLRSERYPYYSNYYKVFTMPCQILFSQEKNRNLSIFSNTYIKHKITAYYGVELARGRFHRAKLLRKNNVTDHMNTLLRPGNGSIV